MTVLTIRSHRRYALRQPVLLGKPGRRAAEGLLIELSAEGCRISNLARGEFVTGETVTVELDDLRLDGRVRWAHDGVAGIRLEQPLFSSQLGEIVSRGRDQSPAPRYGT